METIRSKTGARQLQKDARRQFPPKVELAFYLQDWGDAYNVGGMFRVADACGASEIVTSGRTPVPPDPMIGVTSLGHHRRVPVRSFPRHDDACDALLADGWTLVAVEIADQAVPYNEFEFASKTCLVMGNEEKGVYSGVLKRCVAAVFVPMYGKGRSMNVHVAAAVVAFRAVLG